MNAQSLDLFGTFIILYAVSMGTVFIFNFCLNSKKQKKKKSTDDTTEQK